MSETGQLKAQRDFQLSRIQKRCSGRGETGVPGFFVQKTGENKVNYCELFHCKNRVRGLSHHPVS